MKPLYPMRPAFGVELTRQNVIGVFREARAGYLCQPKLNGHRLLVYCDGDTVRFQTRHGDAYTFAVGNAAALVALPADTILDGENYKGAFAPFDVLRLAGRDLCGLPVETRTAEAQRLCDRYCLPWLFAEPTESLLADCGANLPDIEGFVLKQRGSLYRPHKKPHHESLSWLKCKW